MRCIRRVFSVFLSRQRLSSYMVAMFLSGLLGCASGQPVRGSLSGSTQLSENNRPVLSSRELTRQQQPFDGRLPLGIGARFDLFVADTASGMADFYNSYLEPLRRGKLFERQPYQLDYSLLPKKGEAFQNSSKSSLLNSVSIKSDYKLQIGISREFISISDFFKPAFWLGQGKYSTSDAIRHPEMTFEDYRLQELLEEDEPLDLNSPVDLNINSLLDERWGLTP